MMSVLKDKVKLGKVQFRSQKEVNEEHRLKREEARIAVNERVRRILNGEKKSS